MLRRLVLLAAILVAVAVALVVWRLRTTGTIGPFGSGTPVARPEGPPIPDARGRLAYVRDGDLWAYDLRAGLEQRLTKDGGVSAPRWSGNGGWIAFARNGRLWVMRADGSGAYAVPGGDTPEAAQWAGRSSRLAYVSSDGSLSILEPAQGERGRRVVAGAGSGAGPRIVWSTDGARLAYERHQRAAPGISNEAIWIVSATGRNPQPVYIASGDFSLKLAGWTSTDRYLWFWQGGNAAGATSGLPLFVTRASSSQPVLLAPPMLPRVDWTTAAPRQDAVAVVTGPDPDATASKSLLAAFLEEAAGGRMLVRSVTLEDSDALAPADPAWSPQGSTIAYSVGPSLISVSGDLAVSVARRRIWAVQGDGSQKRSLLSEATVPAGVADERPVWARDGKTLLFVRRVQPEQALRAQGPTPQGVELWVSSADGRVSRRVAGGITDPGLGDRGQVDWSALFDYYRG